jgi:hypothetical protein
MADAATQTIEMPRRAFSPLVWFWLPIVARTVALIAVVVLAASGFNRACLVVVVALAMITPIRSEAFRTTMERSVRREARSRLQLLGVAVARGNRETVPTLLFLGNPGLLAERSRPRTIVMYGIAIVLIVGGVSLIQVIEPIMAPPTGARWFAFGIGFTLMFLALVPVVLRWLLARRDDAALVRWELTRARPEADDAQIESRRWPSILFGLDWDQKIIGLRDAWNSSEVGSPEREANFRALEETIGDLQRAAASKNGESADRRYRCAVLRRAAWILATDLDPAIANY